MNNVTSEETIVGIHESGIELQEGANISISRFFCSNCKRQIHCFVKVDRITKEAIVHNNCTNSVCECNCKKRYDCPSCGNTHPYGQKCNRIEPVSVKNPQIDKEIDEINAKWNKLQAEKKQNIPQIKKDD